jgi:S1-C subfamily serine protease
MRSRKSVVAVIVERPPSPDNEQGMSFGSGFIIKDGPPSLVLTCQHVVKGAVSVRIRLAVVGAGVQEFAATVIESDELRDIAVLRVPRLRSERSLALNFTPPLQVNEPAVTIGYCNPEDLLKQVSLVRLPATSPGCIW